MNFLEQAALFSWRSGRTHPAPARRITSFAIALNDVGSALVTSFDASFQPTLVLYRNGQSTVLDFGPSVTNASQLGINNRGIVSGTQGDDLCDGGTGFRFDPRTGQVALLRRLSTTRPPGESTSTTAGKCSAIPSSAVGWSASEFGIAVVSSRPILLREPTRFLPSAIGCSLTTTTDCHHLRIVSRRRSGKEQLPRTQTRHSVQSGRSRGRPPSRVQPFPHQGHQRTWGHDWC